MKSYTFEINTGKAISTVTLTKNSNLYDLAEILLESIGFDLDHAFGFYSNLDGPVGMRRDEGEHYTLFADMGDMMEDELGGAGSVKNTTVDKVFKKGRKMLFFFDYGDAWSFVVTCTDVQKNTDKRPSPQVLSRKGTFPEQYPDHEQDLPNITAETSKEQKIITFPKERKTPDQTLPLFVYLSGRSQKLFGIKASELPKDDETNLKKPTWLSLWRCEHLLTDPEEDKHLFIFTHATTFFTIVVFQEGLCIQSCLRQFQDELLFRLENFISIPEPLKISLQTIKGNPRGLITTMNQIIFEATYHLEERFQSYEVLESDINHRFRSKEFFRPSEEFSLNLKNHSPFNEI